MACPVGRADGPGRDRAPRAGLARVIGGAGGAVFDTVFFCAIGTLARGRGAEKRRLDQLEAGGMAQVMAINVDRPAALGPLAQLPAPAAATTGVRRWACLFGRGSARIGENPAGRWYAYRASKAAVNQVVRGAAIEIGAKR